MRELTERRKFLRKQIELLAKESENCFPELLPEYSREIVRLNRELVPFFRVVHGIVLLNFMVYMLVLIKKLCGRQAG